MIRKIRNRISCQKGQGAIEFAMALIVFLAFMFVMTDMVRICLNWVSLQYAVNEGARFGSLISSDRDSSITSRVQEIAAHLGMTGVNVTFESNGTSTSGGGA